MAASRSRGKKKKSSGSKKRPTTARKHSPLKKANRRSSRNKMARNKEKYKSSKQKLQQTRQSHAQTMQAEKKRFADDKKKILGDSKLTPAEKRDKLASAQYQRRLRERAANEHLQGHERAHAAYREQHLAAHQRHQEKYRQRKRAVDFSDRMRRSSTTVTQQSTTVVAPQQGYAAQPMMGYGVPQQGYASQPMMGYGSPGMGYPPPPMDYAAPSEYVPPPAEQDEPPSDYSAQGEDVPQPEERGEQRAEVPTRSVVEGADEEEAAPELKDIVALRDLDPRAFRAFLRARENFERATTPEDKVRYSTEFFELATKLDALFHMHTDVWHRVMKYRPPGRTIEDANAFTDGLSKEAVAELSKMSNDELHDYLVATL